jgi:rSAM/selenodomain-associated transferase 1
MIFEKTSDRALILFAKEPIPGKVKTRLVPPLTPEGAAELYDSMLRDTIARIGLLEGIDRYLFYDGENGALEFFTEAAPGMTCLPQEGADLGERMAEAMRQVIAIGHDIAVIIGSDSPDLPMEFIINSINKLSAGDCEAVFGPTEDGGYYLVGLTRLHEELFIGIPWSSDRVMDETLARAAKAGIRASLLPLWHDVDSAADLDRPELLEEASLAPLTREFLLIHNDLFQR